MSAFTPRRLQIDGSAPFWSNSFTHSKWPSRQACINGDHPYLFKASKYSGYCKISSSAITCSKNGINHIQHKDQFSHSEILNLSSWIWFFVWQRYSEISDINHSAKLPYCPTWGQISSNWYELAVSFGKRLGLGVPSFASWHKARIFGTRFLMQYYRNKLQCEVVYFHPQNEDEAYKSYIFQSERLDSSWPRPMVIGFMFHPCSIQRI